jgi:hypothetical protein
MRYPKEKAQITFGGVQLNISWTKYNSTSLAYATISRPQVKKILREGKVRVHCAYSYTDDYAFDAYQNNFGKRNNVGAAHLLKRMEELNFGSASLCSDEPNVIRFSFHTNNSYKIEALA